MAFDGHSTGSGTVRIYVVLNRLLQAMGLLKAGKTSVWTKYTRPKKGIGVGLNEAMRGAIGHWLVMEKGKVHRYQIITPTGWNASPRGPTGNPKDSMGDYEEATTDSLVMEMLQSPLKGLDIVRTVRGFDPYLTYNIHVYDGNKTLVTKHSL